jgi:hypothetical protein
MSFKSLIILALCIAWMPLAAAQADAPEALTADGVYRQALNAYLDGHFDESIALAAKSLTLDPKHEKSKYLLSVLIFEKERERKNIIWRDGKPVTLAPVPSYPAFPKGLEEKLKLLQLKLKRFFSSSAARDAEREMQIDIMLALLESGEGGHYRELRRYLGEIDRQLRAIQAEGRPDLRLLYLLCGLSLFFSFLALWKAAGNKQTGDKTPLPPG